MITLGFDGFYITLNQDSLTDSRLTSAITQAVRDGLVTPDGYASLVIPAEDNRRAVIEISFAADHDDIDRAKTRPSSRRDCTRPNRPRRKRPE